MCPLPRSIPNAASLVTPRETICREFLAQAKKKAEASAPYIEDGLKLWGILQDVKTLDDAVRLIPPEKLVTMVGFSEKARGHFSSEELRFLVKKALENIVTRAGPMLREELFGRYLLIRGDSLGGAMRNVTGAVAQSKLANKVVSALNSARLNPTVTKPGEKITKIDWGQRRLLFDRRMPLVGKNVDVILAKCEGLKIEDRKILENTDSFLACGELKGGIDPAGADEHWKTTGSALARIREKLKPSLKIFFVGAAIERAMADELFLRLQKEEISCAANLHVDTQMDELVAWLLSI